MRVASRSPRILDQVMPACGAALLALTATTWVVDGEHQRTFYEVFGEAKGGMLVVIPVVLAFAVACVLWPVHRSRAVVVALGLPAALGSALVVLSGMDSSASPLITLVLCLLVSVGVLVRRADA